MLAVFEAGNHFHSTELQAHFCIDRQAFYWLLILPLAGQWSVKYISFHCVLEFKFGQFSACTFNLLFSSWISFSCFDIWLEFLFIWRTNLSKWGSMAATCLTNTELAKQSIKARYGTWNPFFLIFNIFLWNLVWITGVPKWKKKYDFFSDFIPGCHGNHGKYPKISENNHSRQLIFLSNHSSHLDKQYLIL